jgi:GcrA cell cycle regulator
MRLGDRGAMRAVGAPNLRFLGIFAVSRCRLRAALTLSAAQNRPRQPRGRSMSIETWTAERIEQLRNFVVSGLTCSQIAAEIGVTRNAVIGKIHRLGLSPARPAGAPARSSPPRARSPRFSPQSRLFRLIDGQAPCIAAEPAPIDSAQRCSLLEIAQDKCHWPIGDPLAANFAFCGNAAIAGFSYCAGHARMAYRLPVRRRA